MSSRRIRIAIDGPASSGKGTVSRAVAASLGYLHIDTGALYRAVALSAKRAGVSWEDPAALTALVVSLPLSLVSDGAEAAVHVDGEDVSDAIRGADMGEGASAVARHPGVRDGLLGLQRRLAVGGGVVMDGRDIGTIVLPDAELKVYLTADLEVRARRRTDDLALRGEVVPYDKVLADLTVRDHRDMTREVAPLRAAHDAVVVDSSLLSVDAAVRAVVESARQRGA